MTEILSHCFHRQGISRIYLCKVILAHEAQGSQAEEGVEHVRPIARSVSEAAACAILVRVLAI